MKNIKIEKTTNNTYVVKADTERFGKQRIIFESYKINDCINYLKSFEKFSFRITESVYQQVAEILRVEEMQVEMDISLEERQVKNYDERNYYGVK